MTEFPFPAYESGYFPVSDGHQLYYEKFGNSEGVPVLFIHGGPGAGCFDQDKRFFDPELHHVLLFDQRGSHRSKPFASTEANTTDHLVEDMEALLDWWGVGKVILFGGSWGSTLSLVYGIRHPERVSGMVLRGIYLNNKRDHDHFMCGGVASFRPDVWERFTSFVPEEYKNDPSPYYLEKMLEGTDEERTKYAREYARYELILCKMRITDEEVEAILNTFPYESLSILESHYLKHRCFLPENYILEKADKIAEVPISIVHGKYDLVCVPAQAYELHAKLKCSTLHMVVGGHSSSEPEVEEKLKEEVKRLAQEIGS